MPQNVNDAIRSLSYSLFYGTVMSVSADGRMEFEDSFKTEGLEAGTSNAYKPAPFVTAPSDLPRFAVTRGDGKVGDGYIFMSPYSYITVGRLADYLLILDDNAEPVYYHRFDRLPNAMDFKRQSNVQLTYYNRIHSESVALNNHYEVVGSYTAGNGYKADLHDMQILDDGHALLLIYDRQKVDMSAIYPGGDPNADVMGCIVQELDAASHVVFEWRSWDHIDILDSTVDFTTHLVNYMNCNSIERDNDGNLLLSSRNLSEVTKIDRQTGDVIWRMGGKKNEFEFTNDGGFSQQHDARRLDNGLITLYDNGVSNSPAISRGLDLEVDEINKTVSVVREFRNTPDTFAAALGNMQRLTGGNSIVGWGRSSKPIFTEFDSLGRMALQFSAFDEIASYRTFRFPWQGYPTWPPALIAYADEQDVTLFFSWNGATETYGYMVFAQPDHGPEQYIANVAKEGFENSYTITVPYEGIWRFRIVPIDRDRQPKISSNEVTLLIGGRSVFLPVTISDMELFHGQKY